jgi:hypothetical protein
MKKMVMMLMAGTVIGALAMRPKCATTVAAAMASPRVDVSKVPDPLTIASFAAPTSTSTGRNVFAYRSVEDRRSRLSPVAQEQGQARVPVLHREDDAPQAPAQVSAPAYRYLGAFGPAEYPIAVIKIGGDVVNVPLRKP